MPVTTDTINQLLVLLAVLVVECGGGLSLAVGVALLGARQQTPRHVEQKPDTRIDAQPAQPQTQLPDTKTSSEPNKPGPKPRGKRKAKRIKKRTRQKAKRLGNVIRLVREKGGHVKGGQRAMAKQLRMSRSRLNEVLHEAAKAGAVKLHTSRAGTTVRLIA